MAAILRAAVLSVPPVVAAVWTFRHLNEAVGPFLNPIVEDCKAQAAASPSNPLVTFFDFFNCFMIPFFKEVVSRDAGVLVWGNFAALGASVGGFLPVESSRLGARFPLFLHALYSFIFNFIGVSIGVPLLWLPAYFAVGMPSTFTSSSSLKISWPRVWAIWFFNLVFFTAGIACLVQWTHSSWLDVTIKATLWLPVLCAPLWLALPVTKSSNAHKGQQAVIFMHCFNAGIAFACHVILALFFANRPYVIPSLAELFESHEGGAACVYFLLVDLFVFWGACVYQVLVEEGPVAALAVVAATPVLGLGAPLSFYYMYRESKIFDYGASIDAVEESKTKAE